MAITVNRTAPLAAPGSPSAATGTASGTLTNGKTYYYKIAAITAADGLQGVPTSEVSATANANGSINLSWSSVPGAYAYMVWRTPTSGDYSVGYFSGGNYTSDQGMMFLRNGNLYFANFYTTTGTSLTDIGTTTERASGYGYYRVWHNRQLRPYGSGQIQVSGGTSGDEANFEDIYSDAVANGYDTTTFQKLWSTEGHKTYLCYDQIDIQGYWIDFDCTIYLTEPITTDGDTNPKRFGQLHINGFGYAGVTFILINPCGRQESQGFSLKATVLYGCCLLRDFGASYPQNDDYVSGNWAHTSVMNVYQGTEAIDSVLEDNGQGTYLRDTTGIVLRRARLTRNQRGFNMYVDQSLNTFDVVNVDTSIYVTTGLGGTLRGCTIGINANAHRFFNVTGVSRSLVDCIFPNGDGLPASASNGGTAINNEIFLKWSFDLLVTDKEGNPIQSAAVTLDSSQNNRISLTTGATGETATQELTEARYYGDVASSNFSNTENHTPYVLTISKQGYQTYRTILAIEQTTSLVVRLNRSPFAN